MPETKNSEENVAYIRTHVDAVEQLTKFSIAANPNSKEYVKETLASRKGAAEVYLAISVEHSNQDQLIKKTGKSRANVSKILKYLLQNGLIQKYPDPANKKVSKYCPTELEKMLGVSRIAKKLSKKQV